MIGELGGWVSLKRTLHLRKMRLMGIAEFIIGRAFRAPLANRLTC